MEKWKMGVIALLILAFGGFAALQNSNGNNHNPDAPNPAPTNALPPGVTPTPDPLTTLPGTKPLPWTFDKSQWANAPRPFTPADLRGKVTVIEFWRMMCSHCQDAVPFMNMLKQKYGSQGLQIITFQSPGDITDSQNPERNWQTVQTWMKEHDVQYPVAFDADRKLKTKYKVEYYPFLMLVDRNGIIRYTHTGHTDDKAQALVQAIESELAKK